jgi:hypothetical protein
MSDKRNNYNIQYIVLLVAVLNIKNIMHFLLFFCLHQCYCDRFAQMQFDITHCNYINANCPVFWAREGEEDWERPSFLCAGV